MFGWFKRKEVEAVPEVFGGIEYDRPRAAYAAARKLGVSVEALDAAMARHAGGRFEKLLGADGGARGYFPTLKRTPDALLLADAYDYAREFQGDPRRAFRGLGA